MPNEYNPVDGQPWPLSAFLRDSPLWAPSGVVGAPAATASAGDLALSFDIVSGTSVTPKLALGRGRSRGGRYERTVSPWASGLSGTAPQQGSALYGLNTGSNQRRDRIVLRRDAALQAVYPIILVGTPAASPAAVALTQVETGIWDTPLFSWTLPGGSSTAPANITDEREWIDPDGHGLQWMSFIPTLRTAAGSPTIGNGTLTGRYRRQGKLIVVRIFLSVGSTSNMGAGVITFDLPLPAVNDGSFQNLAVKAFTSDSKVYPGSADIAPGGTVCSPLLPRSSTTTDMTNAQGANNAGAAGTGIPVVASDFTFKAGSNISIFGTYEAA